MIGPKIAKKFSSFEQAEDADYEAYRKLTAIERLQMALKLYWMWRDAKDPASHRLERVYRVTKLEQC